MFMYNWFILLYRRQEHSIVNQLYSHKNLKGGGDYFQSFSWRPPASRAGSKCRTPWEARSPSQAAFRASPLQFLLPYSVVFLSQSSVTELIWFVPLLAGLLSVTWGQNWAPHPPESWNACLSDSPLRSQDPKDARFLLCSAYMFWVNIGCVKGYLKYARVLWPNKLTYRPYPAGEREPLPNTIQTRCFSVALREPGKRTKTARRPVGGETLKSIPVSAHRQGFCRAPKQAEKRLVPTGNHAHHGLSHGGRVRESLYSHVVWCADKRTRSHTWGCNCAQLHMHNALRNMDVKLSAG